MILRPETQRLRNVYSCQYVPACCSRSPALMHCSSILLNVYYKLLFTVITWPFDAGLRHIHHRRSCLVLRRERPCHYACTYTPLVSKFILQRAGPSICGESTACARSCSLSFCKGEVNLVFLSRAVFHQKRSWTIRVASTLFN
jgi:hypothetical protein